MPQFFDDTSSSDSAPKFVPKPGDGWVHCRCGARHWGINGAAGLFLVRGHGNDIEVLLQHRALWSHQGGTWAVPGGAIMDGESPVQAALREAHEEAGLCSENLEILGSSVLDHVDWAYTTVVARAPERIQAFFPADNESIEISWSPVRPLIEGTPNRTLLPAFEAALPELLKIVHNQPF